MMEIRDEFLSEEDLERGMMNLKMWRFAPVLFNGCFAAD